MAWDKTKPATSGALVSADHRSNWTALETAIGAVNLLADPTFLIWQAGDAAAGAHWTLTGAGAAIARTGTGLGDTTRKVGPYAAKVTAGGAAVAFLNQSLLTTTSFDTLFQSAAVSMGAWVWASAGSAVRLRIDDGVTSSFSSFHTGNSTWQFLTIAGASLNVAATKIVAGLEVAISLVGYFSGPTFLLGQVPPATYMPAPVEYLEFFWQSLGVLTVGANKVLYRPRRPAIVKDVQLEVGTSPATQAIIIDVNTWDGAAMTSMFTTRPQIAAAGGFNGARPDTTYARRCFTGGFDTATPAGSILGIDIDQVGVGPAGSDLTVHVRYLTYARPLEAFLGYNELN